MQVKAGVRSQASICLQGHHSGGAAAPAEWDTGGEQLQEPAALDTAQEHSRAARLSSQGPPGLQQAPAQQCCPARQQPLLGSPESSLDPAAQQRGVPGQQPLLGGQGQRAQAPAAGDRCGLAGQQPLWSVQQQTLQSASTAEQHAAEALLQGHLQSSMPAVNDLPDLHLVAQDASCLVFVPTQSSRRESCVTGAHASSLGEAGRPELAGFMQEPVQLWTEPEQTQGQQEYSSSSWPRVPNYKPCLAVPLLPIVQPVCAAWCSAGLTTWGIAGRGGAAWTGGGRTAAGQPSGSLHQQSHGNALPGASLPHLACDATPDGAEARPAPGHIAHTDGHDRPLQSGMTWSEEGAPAVPGLARPVAGSSPRGFSQTEDNQQPWQALTPHASQHHADSCAAVTRQSSGSSWHQLQSQAHQPADPDVQLTQQQQQHSHLASESCSAAGSRRQSHVGQYERPWQAGMAKLGHSEPGGEPDGARPAESRMHSSRVGEYDRPWQAGMARPVPEPGADQAQPGSGSRRASRAGEYDKPWLAGMRSGSWQEPLSKPGSPTGSRRQSQTHEGPGLKLALGSGPADHSLPGPQGDAGAKLHRNLSGASTTASAAPALATAEHKDNPEVHDQVTCLCRVMVFQLQPCGEHARCTMLRLRAVCRPVQPAAASALSEPVDCECRYLLVSRAAGWGAGSQFHGEAAERDC